MNGNGLKPGLATTEFWITAVAPQVVSLLVLFGWAKAGDAHSLEDAIKQIAVAVTSLVVNGTLLYNYAKGRHLQKVALINGNSSSEDNTSVTTPIPPIPGGKVK